MTMERIRRGPFRDGLAIDARELAASLRINAGQTKAALLALQAKGFIVNLTPELSIDRALVRLTMFPFQNRPPTQDYVNYQPTPDERRRLEKLDRDEALEAKRRRLAGARK